MACFHPITAYRAPSGEIKIGKQLPDSIHLRLPCGGCLGCRKNAAQAWALRCQLELQSHRTAVFTTLTYNDENLPPTLQTRELQLWLKRLRKNTGKKLRFFACGEYGERTNRPHYHAILYGADLTDSDAIQNTWKNVRTKELLGHTRTEPISPARISYTAGYCQKKIGYKRHIHERVDPQTGEVYIWQPPFKLMSRNPGIGHEAKQYVNSWRLHAVKDGHKMPVPRYLHEAWKQQATEWEKEDLLYQKSNLALNRDTSTQRLHAAEKIAIAQQQLNAQQRKL